LTGENTYIYVNSCRHLKCFILKGIVLILFLWFLFPVIPLFAQEKEEESEEITVFFQVRNVGGTEMPAYIKGEILYLPIPDVFSFLKIQNTPSAGFDTISGFFLTQLSPFFIDQNKSKIDFREKTFYLNPGDLIKTENNLYLKSNYFSEIFGLDCAFDFRSFSVFLTSKIELPVVRLMKQEMMRSNISKLKGEMKTDTSIRRNFPFFHFGAADWSVSANQELFGISSVQCNLTLGALFAGGNMTANLNYNNMEKFDVKNQQWQWHFANNDFHALTQVFLGNIIPMSVSSIHYPVIGASITNTPTTFRRSFGTYTITDYTQPGWIVELYVNYVLVDYTKADASGYFSFEVPLVYGNSNVKLRFYGPWGEEYSREQTILVPFNFLPVRKFEYTISGGAIENPGRDIFSRAVFHYGLSRRLTVGAGAEFLSSVHPNKIMPFVDISLRIGSGLLISAEYVNSVRFLGVLNWRLSSGLMIEGFYTKYNRNQTAIFTNFLEERKLILSKPVNIPGFSSLLRLTLYQVLMDRSNNFSSELLISGSLFGVSTNLTTYAFFAGPSRPFVYSNLSLGFRLPYKIILTPELQYVYTSSKLISVRLKAEKHIFNNGVATFVYDRNLVARMDNVQVGFRYDFPFTQVNVSARYGSSSTSFIQYAKGSLINKGKYGGLGFSNYSSVGKGGIIFTAFLDLNGNGRHDSDEPKVKGINLHINGGRIEKNSNDSTIRVSDLQPYNKYYIELDRNSFESISWRIPKATIDITINPNQYKLIEIPVIVVGEVSGFVYLQKDSLKTGQGRIIVCFYRSDSVFVDRIITESDGYFSYFGLSPGSYFAMPDTAQLRLVHMIGTPAKIPFTISRTKEGDYTTGVEFVLRSTIPDTIQPRIKPNESGIMPASQKPSEKQKEYVTVADTLKPSTVQKKQEKEPSVSKEKERIPVAIPDTGSYCIQVGAFRNKSNAAHSVNALSGFDGHPVIVIFENGLFKVRIKGFQSYQSASEFLKRSVRENAPGAFIFKNR
jgi:hypothetical protein